MATTVFPKRTRKRPLPLEFYGSAVGKKWVMAITGIMIMGFVFAHMVGNLHLYEGPRQVNTYGETLRELGGHLAPRTFVLWLMRLGLIGAVLGHVHAAATLTIINAKARPTGYDRRDYLAANYASRTMRVSGIIVGFYLLFHLADLTGGKVTPDYQRGDVYHNVVESFSRPPVAAFYIVANLLLGIHLFHGAWSLFQSLGLNNPRWNRARRLFAGGFASIVMVGNCAFPMMVLAGVISEDERTWPCQKDVELALDLGATERQVRDAADDQTLATTLMSSSGVAGELVESETPWCTPLTAADFEEKEGAE